MSLRSTNSELLMRILMIRTDRLGDVLLNLPVLAALRQVHPSAHIAMMARPELTELLEGLPLIDELLAYQDDPHRSWWGKARALARRLRPGRFDVVIVSNPRKEFHVAAFLAGIPTRVGYDRKWGWMLTHRLNDAKALGERHEVEYNLDLVRALGIPIPRLEPPASAGGGPRAGSSRADEAGRGTRALPQWQWPRSERCEAEVAHLLEEQGAAPSDSLVAVHPWTSHPRKQWPVSRYRDLVRILAERLPMRVVVIGGPDERSRAQDVLPGGVPVVDLVGRLTLKQLAALLQRARILISNDSGPVHLASAVHTKTVVLFGTSDPGTGPRRWGPWGTEHTIICKPSMEAITVDEVFTTVKQQLNELEG